MASGKIYHDIESNENVTTEQLYKEYLYNVKNGYTEKCTFSEYVYNCLTINNGTLEEI